MDPKKPATQAERRSQGPPRGRLLDGVRVRGSGFVKRMSNALRERRRTNVDDSGRSSSCLDTGSGRSTTSSACLSPTPLMDPRRAAASHHHPGVGLVDAPPGPRCQSAGAPGAAAIQGSDTPPSTHRPLHPSRSARRFTGLVEACWIRSTRRIQRPPGCCPNTSPASICRPIFSGSCGRADSRA